MKKTRTARRPTAGKAKQMLADNSAQGHPLSRQQQKYFGWIAGGAGKARQAVAKRGAALEKLKQSMK